MPDAGMIRGISPSWRGSAPSAGGEPLRDKRLKERTDAWFAVVLWLISGSPVLTSAGIFDAVLVLSVGLFAAYGLLRSLPYRRRAPLFMVAAAGYIAWTAIRHAFIGDSSQWLPLAGHMLKLGVAALFMMTANKPLDALVRGMVLLSVIAIAVFSLRQVAIFLIGFDIADMFSGLYPLTGALPDRSILIFNFDIAAEVHRNSGPFREPGLYAAYLTLSLLFAVSPLCSLTGQARSRCLAVLFVALLSTQSTMGLATIPAILVVWFSTTRNLSPAVLTLTCIVAVITSVLIWRLGGQSDKLQFQMLSFQAQTGGWYTSRLGNAFVDWRAIELKPLLGYGFAETGRPVLWLGGLAPGFGNGLTGSIVKFGWGLGVFIYLILAIGLLRLTGNVVAFLMSLVVFAMLLVGQQLLTLPVVFTILGLNFGPPLLSRRVSGRKTLALPWNGIRPRGMPPSIVAKPRGDFR